MEFEYLVIVDLLMIDPYLKHHLSMTFDEILFFISKSSNNKHQRLINENTNNEQEY